jgi:hypothetical protein
MTSERMKRCTNTGYRANGGIRRVFSAELTTCPLCGSSLRFIDPSRVAGKGSGKGRGKVVDHKLVGYGSGTPKPPASTPKGCDSPQIRRGSRLVM